jgi:hypothetical protein
MSSASSCFVLKWTSSGILHSWRRTGSPAQLSGKYSSASIGACALRVATLSVTPIWQLVIFPAVPVYCRCTPTECVPCFGNPVSSTIHVVTGSRALIASTMCRAATDRTFRSLHGESAAKWSRRWCAASHFVWSPLVAAAIGSALLRSRLLSRPCA